MRRHGGAIHREPQANDETREHDDGKRGTGGIELRRQDLRRPGKNDRRQANGGKRRRADRRGIDTAHEAERNQRDGGGQHAADAGVEVGFRENAGQGRTRTLRGKRQAFIGGRDQRLRLSFDYRRRLQLAR